MKAWASLLAALLMAGAAAAKTVRMGIVAGHNTGADGDPGLRYAEADAQRVAELFQEVGGMEEDNLIMLKSPRPEHMDLAFRQVMEKAAKVAPGDEVVFVFYFSGHGSREFLKLGRQRYGLKELKEKIDQVPAKLRIGIFDACQSGAITRIKGARMVQPFMLEQEVKSNGSILITSSAEDENSQESDQLQGSFFTHHWLSALRGAGDVSGDRRVSLLEAYQYAFQQTLVNTEGTQGGAQHPNAQFKVDVQGDVILTDLSSGSGGLVFQPEVTGNLLVANARAEVMGEFHKEAGREAFLALPPGSYRVFLREGRKTRQCRVRLMGAEAQRVEDKQLTSGFQLTGISKGGAGGYEPESPLPFRVEDWPQQYPLELSLGYAHYYSLVVQVGYRALPHLDLTLSNTSRWTDTRLYGIGADNVDQDMRLGAKLGKFISPNLEVLGSVFHQVSYHRRSAGTTLAEATLGRAETAGSWNFADGTGLEMGVRLWLWSQVSISFGYGTEYNWKQGYFTTSPFNILPGFHF